MGSTHSRNDPMNTQAVLGIFQYHWGRGIGTFTYIYLRSSTYLMAFSGA